MQRLRKPSAIDFSSFERYGDYTDLDRLKEWSGKPLRKSIRVNTLKMSVQDFTVAAAARGWLLSPVPWCREAFFIERPAPPEGETRPALGRDLLHQVGCFYMQEAASMLPAALLGARPGEAILDMSAAPGSKTTQVAAAMRQEEGRAVRGVIVANDVQENRLWTLKANVHRLGATNVIVTKKVGQWFAKHMTERFDRVLCDAPCSAQGTVRKDSDALQYCGMENIQKMARLQYQLLEAAIHAAKVGGRIVYSTCTLTPEENEGVVLQMLQKFGDRLSVVPPEEWGISDVAWAAQPLDDSHRVQEWYAQDQGHPLPSARYPFVRLWPQTLDTEGFFAVVLRKHAPTKDPEEMDRVSFQEEPLPPRRIREAMEHFTETYGTPFVRDGETLYQQGENVLLTTEDVAHFPLPVQDFAIGLPFAKLLKDGRVRLAHESATLRGREATKGILTLTTAQLADILDGRDTTCDPHIRGDMLLMAEGQCIGRGLAKEGVLKNNLPRLMIQQS